MYTGGAMKHSKAIESIMGYSTVFGCAENIKVLAERIDTGLGVHVSVTKYVEWGVANTPPPLKLSKAIEAGLLSCKYGDHAVMSLLLTYVNSHKWSGNNGMKKCAVALVENGDSKGLELFLEIVDLDESMMRACMKMLMKSGNGLGCLLVLLKRINVTFIHCIDEYVIMALKTRSFDVLDELIGLPWLTLTKTDKIIHYSCVVGSIIMFSWMLERGHIVVSRIDEYLVTAGKNCNVEMVIYINSLQKAHAGHQ